MSMEEMGAETVETAQDVAALESSFENDPSVAEVLRRLEESSGELDEQIEARYGAETWDTVKEFMSKGVSWIEGKGDTFIQWAEQKGISPKVSNWILAGGLGVVGALPGAGPLWGLAYLFAKRAIQQGREIDISIRPIQEQMA